MDFVHWETADRDGASGTVGGAQVTLAGPMGTAFYLHDDYPNFSGSDFTPPQPATGMVELVSATGHTFTLSFGAPIREMVLFLGSFGSILTMPAGVVLTRISGDDGFRAAGNTATGVAANAVPLPDGTLSLSDSNGTLALSGVFSSLTFTLTPNFADGSIPDGVFLQVGGTAMASPDDLIAGIQAQHASVQVGWRQVTAIARQLGERAVAASADGQASSSAVFLQASADVLSGTWSAAPGDDPSLAQARQAWDTAAAARAHVVADLAGAQELLARLAITGGQVPVGLLDIPDPLQGPISFCDFDSGFAPTDDSLFTFASARGQWAGGSLRVSVDMTGATIPDDPTLLMAENVIRDAFNTWQDVADQISAIPPKGFFDFDQVPAGAEAQIQSTFVDPSQFHPPKKPDTLVAAAGQSPPSGILHFNKLMTPLLDSLRFRALHEAGHVLGLGHNGVAGTLMFPSDDGTNPGMDDLARKALAMLYGWLPRQDLADRATNDRPSLHVVRRGLNTYVPQMLWRGPLDDETIWHAQFLDNGWTTQADAGVGTSSHSPGLTAVDDPVPGIDIGTRLLLAWKGPGENPGLFWSRQSSPDGPFMLSDGRTSHRTDFGTSNGPAVATLGDRVWLVWAGAPGDSRLFFATLEQAGTGLDWSQQNPIPGANSFQSPALVSWHGRLFLFFTRAGTNAVAFCVHGPELNTGWSEPVDVSYAGATTVDETTQKISTTKLPALTDAAPAAVARPRDIMLVWKAAGERPLHVSLFDGMTFSGEAPISQSGTIAGPAVTALPDVLGTATTLTGPGPTFVAWKGNAGDRTLHWTRINSL